jgi:hypothetical protein
MEKHLSLRMPDGRFEYAALRRLIIAGFTEKDPTRHVEELRRQGIAPPPKLPVFFEMEPGWLTTDAEFTLPSHSCCGEAEAVLLMRSNSLKDALITVGSDITDRKLEKTSIAQAKLMVKPISTNAWGYSDVANVWERLRLRSWIGEGREAYQDGSLESFLPLELIMSRAREALSVSLEESAIFLGTLPLGPGGFRYDEHFRCELAKPDGETLTCAYRARVAKN